MVEYEKMEGKSSLRSTAFAAVVFSTVAVTACLVTFPMVFHYVQTLQATVQGEVEYCKARSKDMWREMLEIQHSARVAAQPRPEETNDFLTRVARQAPSTCKLPVVGVWHSTGFPEVALP